MASDLGIPCCDETRTLVATLAILDLGLDRPWTATPRALAAPDRRRFESVLGASVTEPGRSGARWVPGDASTVRLVNGERSVLVGEARDAARALLALRSAWNDARPTMPTVEGLDPRAVLDVILGPARHLSDPASKAALSAYDVPLPTEEMCASPSRAASEASRIGFPVRIALASPDLRVWDHPDLVADGVDNAARVRDVFRQMMTLAEGRGEDSRALGVTVSATTSSRALLHVSARSVEAGLVVATLGFADPHGLAADDATDLILPCTLDALEGALLRLRGHALLLGDAPRHRRAHIESLGDALLRIAAFVDDWRAEVVRVRIEPLAVLVGGRVEVREACVEVSDAFARSVESMG